MRFLSLFLLLASISTPIDSVFAQSSFGRPLGSLHVSYDPSDVSRNCRNIAPYETFQFYLIVDVDFSDVGLPEENATNAIAAWEASVTIPDEVNVIDRRFTVPSINVGDADNWIVGLWTPIPVRATPIALLEYTAVMFSDTGHLDVETAASSPSSFDDPGGPGPIPGWAESIATGECGTKCIRAFEGWRWCENILHINGSSCGYWGCTVTAVQERSWGSVKARF